ncbi:MAG: S1C family serine protease [Candidatus Nanohaloarchaea archaeon]
MNHELQTKHILLLSVSLSLIAGVIGGYSATKIYSKPTETFQPEPISSQKHPNSSLYKEAYRSLMDSVVSIKVNKVTGGSSQGTGFIWDKKGHIVTNHHVIQNAETVEIRFKKGEWRKASIVGKDIYSDLAVLKVENPPNYTEPLPVAKSNPEPGSFVMALGNPFGLQETITHGIISGVNRSMQTAGNFQIPDTIQTDAPINPGNSGGPLINKQGVVVGVNRAKQGDNIGFAISPAIINRVVPSLIEKGDYTHPYLGISMRTVSPSVAEANNIREADGVLVVETLERGPAAGELQDSRYTAITENSRIPIGGDVIKAINGRSIDSSQELSSYLATQTSPGEKITITILRNQKRKKVEIKLGKRPEP